MTSRSNRSETDKRRIKLFFVIWTLEGMGGSEQVVYDIVRNLNPGSYSLGIISFKDGPIRALYESLGIKVHVITKQKGLDVEFIWQLRKLILSEKVEIINPHHVAPFLFSFIATRFSKVRVVYTEHSRWQIENMSELEKLILAWMLKRADMNVVISKQLEEYYRNDLVIPKEKIRLIVNGVDIERYKFRQKTDKKREFGLAENSKVVGMVANIRPEKNHKLLISGFSEIAKHDEGVHLLLIGPDMMDGEIHQFAKTCEASDKIHFLGEREDVNDLLNMIDVFCLTSIHEGMPLTVLEAMASGVPVIGSDVMGINEVIQDEKNGLLFPLNDKKSFG